MSKTLTVTFHIPYANSKEVIVPSAEGGFERVVIDVNFFQKSWSLELESEVINEEISLIMNMNAVLLSGVKIENSKAM